MGFAATLAIYAGLYVLSKILAKYQPKPESDKGKSSVPAPPEGAPIPVYWGRVRFENPAMVWNTAPEVVDLGGDAAETIGWGMHAMLILGIPPEGFGAGGSADVNFRRLYINGKVQYPFDIQRNVARDMNRDGTTFETSDADIMSLFSYQGTVSGIADVKGFLYFETGITANGNNSITGSNIFASYLPYNRYDEWPSYRAQTKAFLSDDSPMWNPLNPQQMGPGFFYANSVDNPNGEVPAIAIEVVSSVVIDLGGGRPLIQPFSDGEANPAAVIFDILTAPWAKLGLDSAQLDFDSFAAVGETLHDEKHGFSMVLEDTTSAKDLIVGILAQIDGVLYEDPETRKLTLSLTREDYVIGSLPTFNEANVAQVISLSTSAFDETYNEVRIIYKDRAKGYKESTAIAQDMANLTSQGGRVRAVTRSYLGVTTDNLASTLAARDLAEVSVPLMSLRIRVNRDAYTLRPNHCFKFTWAEYGITDMVFRVVNIDFGTLEDSTIVIEAAQDRFAVTSGLMTPPKLMPTPEPAPRAIEQRLFTEAPRWFIRKAIIRGLLSGMDMDQPRGYYLGARPEEGSTAYQARVFTGDDPTLRTDMSQKNYPRATGTVETAYSRTAEPYDTSVGLRVTFNRPFPASTFSEDSDIEFKGKNILYVGGEIMAFESHTFISGTTWRFNNVWRGLLDTVPVAHAVGEDVFFLSDSWKFEGDFFIGNRLDFSEGEGPFSAGMIPLTRGQWMQPGDDAVEYDLLPAPRGRSLLPYPSADVTLDGTKGTFRREEEGFTLGWARRTMNRSTITRGDEPSQDADVDQYEIRHQKIGPHALLGADELIGIATSSDESITMTATAAGYGIIDVFPRTRDLSTDLTNWQDPRLPVEFPCWRNLLANCRFSEALAWNLIAPWSFTGDATRRNTIYALGGAGWFVSGQGDGASADIVMWQDVVISGYHPTNMQAILQFYTRVADAVDFDDLIQVDLIARNISGTQVAIATYGPAMENSYWVRRTLSIANLPSTTHSIRVQVTMTADDEPPTEPNVAIAEMGLWVGQMLEGGLLNPSFPSALTSWTTATGTFTVQTSVPYARDAADAASGYARGGTGTTNEIWQEVSLPTGYEKGYAILEYAQGDEGGADDDLGSAVLEARTTAGGTILATASLAGIKAVGTPSTWARRRLILENIPTGTTIIRTRLIATRTAAGTADACFDSVTLRFHKELDPDYKLDMSVETPPSSLLPRTCSAWYDAYSAFPPPDIMLYDGESLDGAVGIEAELVAPATPYLGKLVGPYDGDHGTWISSAYDFRPGGDALVAADDGAGHFANFAAGESFTVIAVVRPGNGNTTTRRICGRIDGSTGGWCLEFLSTGRFQARIRSGGTTWTASPTDVALPGGFYIVQMNYNAVAGQLSCKVNAGTTANTAVTAGTSIWADEGLLFRIGKAEASDTLFNGQVARIYAWRDVYDVVAQMFQYGAPPPSSFATITTAQTGQLLIPVGEDEENNALAAIYDPGRIPLGRLAGLWGYCPAHAATNICPSRNLLDATAFPVNGTAVATRIGIVGPTGQADAVRVASTVAGDGIRVAALPFSASPTVVTYFWARAIVTGTTGNLSVRLENTSGTLLSNTVVALGYGWTRFRVDMSLWDNSTADGQVRFTPHAAGAPSVGFELANVVVVQTSEVLYALPYGAASSADGLSFSLTSGSITEQFNHEGEIYVEGRLSDAGIGVGPAIGTNVAFNATNGTNNNDRRELSTTNSAASLAHYNATGTSATGTTGALTWASPDWTLRGRWQRAGLLDSTTSWARVLKDATAASARASTFTASTTPLTTLTLQGGVQGIVTRVLLFARELILGQDV
jgi:hypothetical protein